MQRCVSKEQECCSQSPAVGTNDTASARTTTYPSAVPFARSIALSYGGWRLRLPNVRPRRNDERWSCSSSGDQQAQELDSTRSLRAELDAARERIAELERQLAALRARRTTGRDVIPPPPPPDGTGTVARVVQVVQAVRAVRVAQVARAEFRNRRQLEQSRTTNTELRTLIEDLRQQLAASELRRLEQENSVPASALCHATKPAGTSCCDTCRRVQFGPSNELTPC